MRLDLSPESRVLVDLQATGLLKAVGHDPTLTAHPEATTLDLAAPLVVRFSVEGIEVPSHLPESDRSKMLANLRRDVLDSARFPTVELRGRYDGTLDGGKLTGELLVRGDPRRLAMDVRATREGDTLVATGTWQGTLTELGIKPFRALLGALKLKDWIRLRLDARLKIPSTA
ncbi:MAG: hypothetical protein ACLP1X_16765 [Polyangiaceae bacterium]